MTTLKEHQAAMVNLLASGSGIPASASRLAHAMHDVLALITTQPVAAVAHTERRSDATTPGLNDKLLALDVEAVRPKSESQQTYVRDLERMLKQRNNTIRQLKGRVAEVVGQLEQERQKSNELGQSLDRAERGWRIAEREVINNRASKANGDAAYFPSSEQAGVRKEDTHVCEHVWEFEDDGLDRYYRCEKCGVTT